MFIPALQLWQDRQRGGKNFLRFLGRAYVDPALFIRSFLGERYNDVVNHYKRAFAQALPHLPKQELSWRLHFTFGAMSYVLAGTDLVQVLKNTEPKNAVNDEVMMKRVLPFMVAGLQAPAPNS